MLSGRSILITGAAGSIGSALLQRLRQNGSARITGLDLNGASGILPVDIRDRLALRRVFESVRPDVVFHAAALKHVPELESQPAAAVETNVFGTVNVACAARAAGVRTVVLLSTDKAVRPISVMGKTKRLAEQIFQSIDASESRFITVRFGNVLRSSGSVLPIFEEQIKRGGPVTVTHPDMERYFLTCDQATSALVGAAEAGVNRDVFVPEMGQPRSILALAQQMIAGRSIPIEFTGIRPGEKLSEQLWDPDREVLVRKAHQHSVYRPQTEGAGLWTRIEASRTPSGLLALLSDSLPEKSES